MIICNAVLCIVIHGIHCRKFTPKQSLCDDLRGLKHKLFTCTYFFYVYVFLVDVLYSQLICANLIELQIFSCPFNVNLRPYVILLKRLSHLTEKTQSCDFTECLSI